MFNAPRPSQRYAATSANGFGSGSFVADNPLAGSAYDGLDPWSAAPTPAPLPAPARSVSTFTSVIGMCIFSAHYSPSRLIVNDNDLL